MSHGKSIRIFLVDGTPNGVITAEIGQWTGKAIVASRQALGSLVSREEVQRTGVYILTGPDPDREGAETAYVGEGENVLDRIKSHEQSKEFWQRVCVLIASDENLTKAHIKYLESRLVEMAKSGARSRLQNGNTPPRPKLPEPDVADMEYFILQLKTLLPVLGFSLLEPIASQKLKAEPSKASPQFVLDAAGIVAKAREIDGEFVVLKGSMARANGVPSWTTGVATRQQLVADKVLLPNLQDPASLLFQIDATFSSPSLAAAVCLGANTNGRTAWKVAGTNQNYAEWQDSIASAPSSTALDPK